MTHPVFSPGRVAVVTGAASGIGRAACMHFAALGMKVCLADVTDGELALAHEEVAAAARGGADDVMSMDVDVALSEDLRELASTVRDAWDDVALIMNNAVVRDTGSTWGDHEAWRRSLEVNFWGVLNGVAAFVPDMIAAGTPAMVVNTGSKQGITNPPGKPPYNVGKAALKAYTECLQHELRNTEGCAVTAHLLVPGMTTTAGCEHRPGAWWPSQVIEFMVPALERGDFYIICPDDEVTPEMDAKRMRWATGDIIENRPALSRWHPDYKEAFAAS